MRETFISCVTTPPEGFQDAPGSQGPTVRQHSIAFQMIMSSISSCKSVLDIFVPEFSVALTAKSDSKILAKSAIYW